MQIAIDTTAGERERGSLEPLLINPAPRFSLVAGKWLASVVFAWVSLVLTFGLRLIALERALTHEMGIRFDVGATEIGAILAAVLPLGLFSSAVQMLVATFARSYKEAQTYVSFLMFLPMLPALVSALPPIDPVPWMTLIPLLGQHILVTNAIEGDIPSLLSFAASTVTISAATLVCLGFTARLFYREKIIFGW